MNYGTLLTVDKTRNSKLETRNFLWALLLILMLAGMASAQQISGDYVEVRSADVYTGPCFANAEVGLVGDQAILAWRVDKGTWENIRLDGLAVVGVVKANATLGDPFGKPFPAKAVLIVDARADAAQRQALQKFAQSMAKDLLKNIVSVETAPIRLQAGEHHGSVTLSAGNLARVETRGLQEGDHHCGNEETYYPPLTKLSHAMPAFTLMDQFKGKGLGVNWTIEGKRSAFVGTFSL